MGMLAIIRCRISLFQFNIQKNMTIKMGTAVTQWLRCCATNRKVAGSIPVGVIGIFHLHKILLTVQ